MSQHIIYLHGFNSSPQSEKAQRTVAFFDGSPFQVHVPALPPQPNQAISTVKHLINTLGEERLAGFIGSSLGGYFSLYLQSLYHVPAVLINPAVRPYELLQDYLGENTNMYTGERYNVEAHHMDELKALEIEVCPRNQKLYLLTQTGDEVLDYQQAVMKLNGIKMWVQYGGDHAFQNFGTVLPSMQSFFLKMHK